MRNYPKLSVRLAQAEASEIYDSDTQEPLYHILIETNTNDQFDAAYILTHNNIGGSDVEMNLTLEDLESIGGKLIRLALLKEHRDENIIGE